MRPRRPHLLLAALLVVSALAASTAESGTLRADFDSDGRMDSASYLRHGTHSHIQLSLAGRAAPIALPVDGIVLRLTVIDVTGDGRSDLVADSPAGVRLWINVGAGAFVETATAGVEFGWPRLEQGGSPRPPPLQSDSLERQPSPATVRVATSFVRTTHRAHLLVHSLVAARPPGTGSISRAPPACSL
jgi:hypothetical protein